MTAERTTSKAVNPSRLNKFIDTPSAGNATRLQHVAEVKAHTKVKTWDGERCDVRAFESRLAPADNVLLRRDRRAERLLGTDGVPSSGLMVSKHVPVRTDGSSPTEPQLMAPLMVQSEGVARKPEIAHVPVPESVFLREDGLMQPIQRRERLAFETKYHHARRALEQAERDERRLHQIIKGRHATNDILNSDALGSDAGRNRARGEPYKPGLLSHDMALKPCLPRGYQRKDDYAAPRHNTHDRIFNETPMPWDTERAQNLRNEGQAGRPFDIVNGGLVSYFPPTINEKQHSWQGHPSVIVHPYTR